MAILGLLIGSVAFLFLFFKLYYAFGSFMAGFVVGSILMLSTFWKGVAGWEDLIGLLSFLMFLAIGLGAGLLAQLIVFLVKKSRKT